MELMRLRNGNIIDRCDLPIPHSSDQEIIRVFYKNSEALTEEDTHNCLQFCFSPEDVKFIESTFSLEKFKTINDTNGLRVWHLLNLARSEQLIQTNLQLAKEIDRKYRVIDFSSYMFAQKSWIEEDAYLLGTRLRRKPLDGEVSKDFILNGNGLRFKIFMLKEYPEMFEEI